MQNYADALESYLIPAEEGLMDKMKSVGSAIINGIISMIKKLVNKIIAGVNYLKNKIKTTKDDPSSPSISNGAALSIGKTGNTSTTSEKDSQTVSGVKVLPNKERLDKKLKSVTAKLVNSNRKINSELNKMCNRAYLMTKGESIPLNEIDRMEASLDNILEDMPAYVDEVQNIYHAGGRLSTSDALMHMVGLKADIALLNSICATFEKMQQFNKNENSKKVIDQLCKSVKHSISISITVVDLIPSLCK